MLNNFVDDHSITHVEQKEVPLKVLGKSSLIDREWSPSITNTLSTTPKVWTRGLLYLIVAIVIAVLPWAVFTKIDETGTAKGKIEPKDGSTKLDSNVAGTVSKILVNEGDTVKAGQVLLTIGSELVESELKQAQDKLQGQINRLNQLNASKDQLTLSLSTQQQQNKAAELEKSSLIDQAKYNSVSARSTYLPLESEKRAQVSKARQNLSSAKNSYDLLKAEKQAQIDQAQVAYQSQKDSLKNNAIILANARRELVRYMQAQKEGIVAGIQVSAKEDLVQEKQRIYDQNKSGIEQTRLRLNEQIGNYNKIMAQTQAEIQQNSLNLDEQNGNYGQTVGQAKSDIEQATLQSQQQMRSLQSLIHSNALSLLKIKEQIRSHDTNSGLLAAEIAQSEGRVKALEFQLSQRTVRAPISGIIYQFPIQKAGAVVQQGTPIAEIASQQSGLVLRAIMPTSDSAYIKKGLSAKLKFDAYPFQDYGVVAGEILSVSPTTSVKETTRGKVEAYKVEVGINQTCLKNNNKCIPLHPGDTATAEVIVRQRRIIDFVIDPFKKMQGGDLKL
jgi:HlyD family secretion protein